MRNHYILRKKQKFDFKKIEDVLLLQVHWNNGGGGLVLPKIGMNRGKNSPPKSLELLPPSGFSDLPTALGLYECHFMQHIK